MRVNSKHENLNILETQKTRLLPFEGRAKVSFKDVIVSCLLRRKENVFILPVGSVWKFKTDGRAMLDRHC